VATRKEYNACMRPYITGSKPKEQRKLDFCVGAKICSGKAPSREDAIQLCSLPKESKTLKKSVQQATPQKNNPCASIIDMGTWVQQPSGDGICRPCLLAPLTQWYMDVLRTEGMNNLATDLEGAVDGGEIALATKLDEVKDKVSPDLKARLKEFDCHAQLYKGEEGGN
jgi:hypothetical protein